jgi:hypothetical protein
MKPSELKIGSVYFLCSWWSLKFPAPDIETWVYDGIFQSDDKNTEVVHTFINPEWYFREQILKELTPEQRESYTKPKGPRFINVPESDIEHLIYDLSRLKEFVNSELGNEPNASTIYG